MANASAVLERTREALEANRVRVIDLFREWDASVRARYGLDPWSRPLLDPYSTRLGCQPYANLAMALLWGRLCGGAFAPMLLASSLPLPHTCILATCALLRVLCCAHTLLPIPSRTHPERTLHRATAW